MQNDITVGVYGLNKNESYTPIFYAQNTDVDILIFAGRGGRGRFFTPENNLPSKCRSGQNRVKMSVTRKHFKSILRNRKVELYAKKV